MSIQISSDHALHWNSNKLFLKAEFLESWTSKTVVVTLFSMLFQSNSILTDIELSSSPIIGLITWSPNVFGSWWGVAGWPDVVTMTVSKYFLIITTIKYFCLTNNGRNVIHRINDTGPTRSSHHGCTCNRLGENF